MREIFGQVIANGNFDLTTLLRNIDCYHIEGKLTDDERTELYANARAAIKPEYDYNTEIAALWVEIRKLQNAVKELQNAGESSGSTETPTDDGLFMFNLPVVMMLIRRMTRLLIMVSIIYVLWITACGIQIIIPQAGLNNKIDN